MKRCYGKEEKKRDKNEREEHFPELKYRKDKEEHEEGNPCYSSICCKKHGGVYEGDCSCENFLVCVASKDNKKKCRERNKRGEIETENVRVAECSEDTRNANTFILKADIEDELIYSNEYRDN